MFVLVPATGGSVIGVKRPRRKWCRLLPARVRVESIISFLLLYPVGRVPSRLPSIRLVPLFSAVNLGNLPPLSIFDFCSSIFVLKFSFLTFDIV